MDQLPSTRNDAAQSPPQTAPASPDHAPAPTPDRPAPGRPEARPADRVQRLPSYAVLLHNDDAILMDYVVETICELTPLDQQHASTIMIEAHTSGIALVLTTHRERAELYAEQFRSKGLTVSVQPAL